MKSRFPTTDFSTIDFVRVQALGSERTYTLAVRQVPTRLSGDFLLIILDEYPLFNRVIYPVVRRNEHRTDYSTNWTTSEISGLVEIAFCETHFVVSLG